MLKLAEAFCSPQGEGHLSGKLMFFIRFAGCSVTTCQLHPANKARVGDCDTNWRYQFKVDDVSALVAQAFAEVGPRGWVCITGGEPMDQPQAIEALIAELGRAGLMINIQTSGTKWVTCPWDWLTVSPKCKPAELVQGFGQELKLVYSGQSDKELVEWYRSTKFWNYYLMPLWKNGNHNIAETIGAIKRMAAAGAPWELTTQSHKWWGVR